MLDCILMRVVFAMFSCEQRDATRSCRFLLPSDTTLELYGHIQTAVKIESWKFKNNYGVWWAVF